MRKAFALMVVLVVSSIAPATAVIGFCAKMPCCSAEAHEGLAFDTQRSHCCSTISCFEAPPHDVTVPVKAKTFTATAPAALAVVATVPVSPLKAKRSFDDTSPPPTTKQRLSSLSLFLI